MSREDRSRDERVGGYDVTFSAPKSVSLLWALADPEMRARSSKPRRQRSPLRSACSTATPHSAAAARAAGSVNGSTSRSRSSGMAKHGRQNTTTD
ncbi:hypothetical protein CTI14_01275 [Methylobacterium radiotolerans]|nr:hypothetical protein CTI14_01275 [Methylobacterium radiotolerans]